MPMILTLVIGAAAGAVLGFGYYRLVGCPTGACPLDLLHEAGFEPDVSDPTGQALLREVRQRHAEKSSPQS